MSDLKGVKPGDKLVLVETRGGGTGPATKPFRVQTVTVQKAGTKLLYVAENDNFPARAFHVDNGHAKVHVGHDQRLWLPKVWQVEERRPAITEALREFGVEVWRKQQPVPVLEAMLKVLEEAEGVER